MSVGRPDVEARRRELVEHATGNRKVQVTVGYHSYRCCGGGWQIRNHGGKYNGTVLSVDEGNFLLQIDNPLRGKSAELCATLASMKHVKPLVD